jgi:hypothetical protein
LHTASKGRKIDHVIKCSYLFHISEQGHADDGVNKSDQSEQRSDVEQGRKRNNQGKQQLTDALGSL